MAISQISSSSLASASYVNPYAKAEQDSSVSQVKQDEQKSSQSTKTDTVTISQQALQMAKNQENAISESKENTTKQRQEAERDKK